MIRTHKLFFLGLLPLSAALALGASAALAGDDSSAAPATRLKLLLGHGESKDRLVVDDLGDLAAGDQRTYSTEQGQSVTVTRDEKGYEIDIDGRKIRVNELATVDEQAGGERRIEKKILLSDDGDDAQTMVFHSSGADEEGPLHIVRRVGPGGEHAFVVRTGDAPPLLGVDAVIARLEKNAKFQGLDAATRQTVLAALRESAPPAPRWIAEDGKGHPGEKVIVLQIDEENPGKE